MYMGLPEFKRCCLCLPLRRGLIGWGYANLILDIFATVPLINSTVWTLRHRTSDSWGLALLLTSVISLLINTGFTVLLITAAHKKSAKLLRISYIYNVVWLFVLTSSVTYFVIDGAVWRAKLFYEFGYDQDIAIVLLANAVILYSIVFVQVYVTLLTRSEAIKLKNQSLEVQFVNNAAEGEARCVCADTKHSAAQDSDCTQVIGKNMEYKRDVVVSINA